MPPIEHRHDSPFVLKPNDAQWVTLGVAAGYALIIFICNGALTHAGHRSPQCLQSVERLLHIDLLYPFKLLTVGMHEMCHAIAGVLTCARIEHVNINPNEGGTTRMRGGIPLITLPAGYLGSSLIGAGLIACGFDIIASRIASIVLVFFFLLTLYWARKDLKFEFLIFASITALLVIAWVVYSSVALRFLILFIGVMSCLYSVWDIYDDTIRRKVNQSDASAFAKHFGGSSRMWGIFWLLMSFAFFIGGVLLGIAVFKDDWHTQIRKADSFPLGSAHKMPR